MLSFQLGVADMTAAPHMAHVVNGFRLLSAAGMVLMVNLPSVCPRFVHCPPLRFLIDLQGVMIYLITSIAASCVQTLALRQPIIRRALKIPIVQRQNQLRSATFRESYEYARKWWQDKKEEQAAIARARRK